MKTKFFLMSSFFITIFIMISPISVVASDNNLKTSTPLSFTQEYPLVQQDISLGSGISIRAQAKLTIREDLVLLTESSYKYAESGKTTTLNMDASNFIALVELNGTVTAYVSGLSIPLYNLNLKQAIPQEIGKHQQVILGGDQLIYTGTIPILGTQISIFMRPVVEWTPLLSGSLTINGPATASPSTISWTQKSASTQVSFSGTQPVDISLSNPTLVFSNLKVVLYFYAIVMAIPTPTVPIDLVKLGDYSASSSTVNLISFDPNYYVLYNELKHSLDSLATTISQMQTQINQLSDRVNSLSGSSILSVQTLAIIGIIMSVVAVIISLYSIRRKG